MKRSILQGKLLLMACLILSACSGTRLLPPGEKLYTGAEVNLVSTQKIDRQKKRSVHRTAEAALYPPPNKSLLGVRFRLWKYLVAGDAPKSKLKQWLRKTGEAPVLISNVKPAVTASVVDARLFNIGVFNSATEYKIKEAKHTARVIYTSHIQKPYHVKEIIYAVSDDDLSSLILSQKEKTLILPGDDYSLEKLKKERIRIDAFLKENGYFYFNADYLLFKADTSATDQNVSFILTLKDSITQKALTVYHINNVYIDQAYSLNEDDTLEASDTTRYGHIIFAGKSTEMHIRPKVIARSVYLKKTEVYSRRNHNITLNRLMSMGNFKFVSIKFSDADTAAAGLLDVTILMTPMPDYAFKAEIDIVSKSNNYTGPRINLSILDRNTFRGAELLNFSIAGSWETQLSGVNKNLQSYSLSPEIGLDFPRFVVPFKMKRTSGMYMPKTHFSLSYDYLKRGSYFDMRSFQFLYGFKWKEDIRKEHELNPVSASYTAVANQSKAFTEILAANQYLAKSYEDQFITGARYSFTYNELVLPEKIMQYYFQLTSEVAGNAFSLANVISGKKVSSETPLKVAGSVYSQFARLSLDGRGFYNFANKDKIAFRVFAGLAKPYGNSSTLPYAKQFFSGGPSSVRAFNINSLGPGIYNQNEDSLSFLQLGGDVKLEINAEYRFNIYRFLKGALFADAGNVWLLQSNPSGTGSPFSFSGFADEMAVGAGFGLRIDVSFFLLRFDLATPLRKPWLEEHHRWVTSQIAPGSPAWRRDNLILNVAIGYPF